MNIQVVPIKTKSNIVSVRYDNGTKHKIDNTFGIKRFINRENQPLFEHFLFFREDLIALDYHKWYHSYETGIQTKFFKSELRDKISDLRCYYDAMCALKDDNIVRFNNIMMHRLCTKGINQININNKQLVKLPYYIGDDKEITIKINDRIINIPLSQQVYVKHRNKATDSFIYLPDNATIGISFKALHRPIYYKVCNNKLIETSEFNNTNDYHQFDFNQIELMTVDVDNPIV